VAIATGQGLNAFQSSVAYQQAAAGAQLAMARNGQWFPEKPPYMKGYGIHYSPARSAYTYVRDSPGPTATDTAPVKVPLGPVQEMIVKLEKELAPWLKRSTENGMV